MPFQQSDSKESQIAPSVEGEEVDLSPASEPSLLSVQVSHSLHRKILQKAQMEGVPVNEFVGELLAEGLVLRAWEIMERKSTMQKPNSSSAGNNRPNNRFRNNGMQNNGGKDLGQNNGGGFRNRNMNSNGGRRMNYNQIMDDSANFLEYVRSQEKKQK